MSIKATDVPQQIVASLEVGLFEQLAGQGKRFLILDLDNTIADGCSYVHDEQAIQTLAIAQEQGCLQTICLLSNVQVPLPWLLKRVRFFAELLDTRYYHAACWPYGKPHPEAVQMALLMMNAKASQTIMIGDQLSKDIRAANAADVHSVLRFPHFGSDPWYRWWKRRSEQQKIHRFLAMQP